MMKALEGITLCCLLLVITVCHVQSGIMLRVGPGFKSPKWMWLDWTQLFQGGVKYLPKQAFIYSIFLVSESVSEEMTKNGVEQIIQDWNYYLQNFR